MRNFLNRLFRKNRSEFRRNEITGKEWYIFPWQYLMVFVLVFIVVLLNVIPNWVVVKDEFGNIDDLFSYPLRDHVVYSTFTLILTIAVAIFVGVFIEIGGYAGPFSSAIFVLVPSLVWLLSDRADNRYEEILSMSKSISNFIFYIGLGIFLIFLVLRIGKTIVLNSTKSLAKRKKMEFSYSYVNRSMFIITNVIIVVTMGYALVNYGVFTLRLAESKHPDGSTLINFGSTKMKVYIALIAVLFALLMVFIGLSNLFVDNTIYGWRKENAIEINVGNIQKSRLDNRKLQRLEKRFNSKQKKYVRKIKEDKEKERGTE